MTKAYLITISNKKEIFKVFKYSVNSQKGGSVV